MSRGLTSAMTSGLGSRQVQTAALVKMAFDSGTDRIWTGYGDITWDSQTWLGAGELLGIRPFSETTDVRATRAQVTISGIPSARISTALQEDYQGREASIYFAVLDSNGDVVVDPAEFTGRMDQMVIDKTGDTMLIRLSIESQLVDLKKPREFRYTDQDQKIDYPNDKGFEYVAGLQDKQLTWGPDNRPFPERFPDAFSGPPPGRGGNAPSYGPGTGNRGPGGGNAPRYGPGTGHRGPGGSTGNRG